MSDEQAPETGMPQEPGSIPSPGRGSISRRRFLVDRHFQFQYVKLALYGGLGVIGVCLIYSLGVRFFMGEKAFDPRMLRVMVALAIFVVLFCAMIAAVTVRMTHRVAGAAFNLERSIDRIARGDYEDPIQLRQGDYLHNIAGALNDLRGTLKARRMDVIQIREALEGLREALPENRHTTLDLACERVMNLYRVLPEAAPDTGVFRPPA